MKKIFEKKHLMYNCPFCKKNVVSSKKTDVHYRNHWIKGCYECFSLSISELTTVDFQTKNY